MNKLLFTAVVSLSLAMPAFGNQRINVLWIGNSLTGQGICNVGDLQLQWYINGCVEACDTSKPSPTGYILASGEALRGATTLAQHWTVKDGLSCADNLPCLTNAVVHDPTAYYWATVDHYDYVVLQPWAMLGDAQIQTESAAFGAYCDTLTTLNVKPVIFGLYQEKDSTAASFAKYTHLYDSLYNKYKDRGVVIAPVWRAYKMVWDVLGPVCLFVAGDVYGHESAMGVFLNHCVFYDVFTRQRSVNIDWNVSLSQCSNLMAVDTGNASLTALVGTLHVFLEQKADEAVSEYYTLTGSTPTIDQSKPHILQVKQASFIRRYDLRGRAVTGLRHGVNPGICVVKNSASSATLELMTSY